MLTKKVLETTLDLYNPKYIYSSDIDAILLKLLNKKYNGMCYKRSYIKEVLQIITRSKITMSTNDFYGSVHIMFLASVIVYSPGEIISGIKIINKTREGNVQGTNNIVAVEVKYDKILDLYPIGATIPIKVIEAVYMLGKNMITMLGSILSPTPEKNIFYICGNDITNDKFMEAKCYYNNALVDNKWADEIQGNEFNFFKKILYPYKTDKDFDEIKKIIPKIQYTVLDFNIEDIKIFKKGIYIIPTEIPLSEMKIIFIDEQFKYDIVREFEVYEKDIFSTLITFINKFSIYKSSIISLCEYYNNKNIINENSQLFLEYQKSKQD